ncbi:MAG: hypothetical protein P1U65_03970 [Minwuia sp.]|nr:hypothetical protein [Minwuia sp.]
MDEAILSVSTELNDDVFDGLRLYGELTGEADNARADRWANHFFRENPLGNGLFVSAKVDDRLVGFISLIDIEMRVDGQTAKAGKAEFWSVRPEFLKLTVGGDRLPWAIFAALRREAAPHGYHVVQTVSPQGSRPLRRAGDLPVQYTFNRWIGPTQPQNRYARRIDRLLFRKHRMTGLAKALRAKAGSQLPNVRRVARLAEPVACGYDNALFSSSEALINYRFPEESFMKLLIDRPGALPCLFVFEQPRRSKPLMLLHTSDRPALGEWAAIAAVALQETAKGSGIGLVMDLPDDLGMSLDDLGFTHTGQSEQVCFLHDATGKGLGGEWQCSHAHMGLYRAIP